MVDHLVNCNMKAFMLQQQKSKSKEIMSILEQLKIKWSIRLKLPESSWSKFQQKKRQNSQKDMKDSIIYLIYKVRPKKQIFTILFEILTARTSRSANRRL